MENTKAEKSNNELVPVWNLKRRAGRSRRPEILSLCLHRTGNKEYEVCIRVSDGKVIDLDVEDRVENINDDDDDDDDDD